jgi:hypothetical protein
VYVVPSVSPETVIGGVALVAVIALGDEITVYESTPYAPPLAAAKLTNTLVASITLALGNPGADGTPPMYV